MAARRLTKAEPATRPLRLESPLPPAKLDRLIHEQIRLGIVSALATQPTLTFGELKRILSTTDGNLSVHARKLEEAQCIACERCSTASSEDGVPPHVRGPGGAVATWTTWSAHPYRSRSPRRFVRLLAG
jgi:hypothetical protein